MNLARIEELKKCCEDFSYFAANYIKIIHPKKGLIPFELLDFQKKLVDTCDAPQGKPWGFGRFQFTQA